MARAGRNDPCPCGSGEKYKSCHLERDEAEAATLRRVRQDVDAAFDQIFGFVEAQDAETILGQAWEDYPASHDDVEPDEDSIFVTWSLVDWHPTGAQSLTASFLAGNPPLPPGPRAALEAVQNSHLSWYEIASVEQGRGLQLRDLLAGGEVFVLEGEEVPFEPGELIFGRIARLPDAAWFDGVSSTILLPGAKDTILEMMAEILEIEPGKTVAPAVLKERHIEILAGYAQLIFEEDAEETFVETYPLLAARAEVLERLRKTPGLVDRGEFTSDEGQEAEIFEWTVGSESTATNGDASAHETHARGLIFLQESTLVAETESPDDASDLRGLLLGRLGTRLGPPEMEVRHAHEHEHEHEHDHDHDHGHDHDHDHGDEGDDD